MNCKKITGECKTCECRNIYCDTYSGYKQGIDALASALRLKCLENVYHHVTLNQIFEVEDELKGDKESSFFNFDDVIKIQCENARRNAIDDFNEKLCEVCSENSSEVYYEGVFCDILTLDHVTDLIFMVAEQMKGE